MADKKREQRMLTRMASLRTAAESSARFRREITEETNVSEMTKEEKDHILYLTDDQLLDDPFNEGIYGSDPDEDLVSAMKEYGFQGVILAYPVPGGKYMIESGHRRRAAARKAGIKKYCVFETKAPENDADRKMRLMLSNLHGRRLSPMRTARIAQVLYDTHKEILANKAASGIKAEGETSLNALVASDLEMNDSTVERYRALLRLIPELQELADSGNYSWSDLSKASPLDEEHQKALYESIVNYSGKYGVDAVTRKWLHAEILRLKKDAAGETEPDSGETPPKVVSYTSKSVLKNMESVQEMMTCTFKIRKTEAPHVIESLEKTVESIEKRIEELRQMLQ